jgi:hypothetical protein
VTGWACPECGGEWIRNFVFNHTNGCTIRWAEDATQAADFERLHTKSVLTRDATDTEILLCQAVFNYTAVDVAEYHDPNLPAPRGYPTKTVVTSDAPGIHRRVVGGLNPDTITREPEL